MVVPFILHLQYMYTLFYQSSCCLKVFSLESFRFVLVCYETFVCINGRQKLFLTLIILMYNDPFLNVTSMWRTACVCNIAHFQCVALFLNALFELSPGLYSHIYHNITKGTFSSALKLFNNLFCPYICKRTKKYKSAT